MQLLVNDSIKHFQLNLNEIKPLKNKQTINVHKDFTLVMTLYTNRGVDKGLMNDYKQMDQVEFNPNEDTFVAIESKDMHLFSIQPFFSNINRPDQKIRKTGNRTFTPMSTNIEVAKQIFTVKPFENFITITNTVTNQYVDISYQYFNVNQFH